MGKGSGGRDGFYGVGWKGRQGVDEGRETIYLEGLRGKRRSDLPAGRLGRLLS